MADEKEYPSEEQWETDETKDEIEEEMNLLEKDEEVYSEEGREKLLEDDEISAEEEAFMQGAEGKGHSGTCAQCGKVLEQDNKEHIIEKEIDGEKVLFCSDECAEVYTDNLE